jgi:uncharacterized repeat protein (TIGR03806 family)
MTTALPPRDKRRIAFHLGTLLLTIAAHAGGLDSPQPVAPYLNGAFPAVPPGEATGWSTVNAFPNLTFVEPLHLSEIPGSNQLLLVCKNGRLLRFENDPATLQSGVVEVLNWSARTQTGDDMGFYSLSFHPEFGQQGSSSADHVYVCYSHRPAAPLTGQSENNTYWTVSRFTWLRASGTLDPASEYVLIRQYDPHGWHNGGATFFGTDGFLHITNGDGGNQNDFFGNSQRLDFGLFGGILRIDVDNDPSKSHAIRRQPLSDPQKPAGWPASYTQGYGIPNDNPWQAANGSLLEEFFAIGLRSPHSGHPDAVTGEIWVGDVGDDNREEMNRITLGDNTQWAFREGSITGPKTAPATVIGTQTTPAIEYAHTAGNACVIGGMRYRGAKWSTQLGGKVIYGDHVSRRIWVADPDASPSPAIEEIISSFPGGSRGLASFATDAAGEVYLIGISGPGENTGVIHKLVPQEITPEAPALLSQTGFFTDLATLTPIPAAIPFSVASPLWSDGSDKHRWLVVPNDGSHNTNAEKIVFSENDNWMFPAGSVLVKHFELPLDARNPALTRRLETRFIICTPDNGKYGVTYKWNTEGSDAVLMTAGLAENHEVTLADGSTTNRTWDYPSRADCMRCHNSAAGQALGARTHQINHDFHYPATGRTGNQLATLNALGMFNTTLTEGQIGDFLAARAPDDESAPLEHRIRSYLDSNCSYCHRPDGPVAGFDARLTTALASQGIIDGEITGRFDLPGGKYIKPGDPFLSAIRVRMASAESPVAMPPLAKNLAHEEAVAALNAYINGLDAAEFETTPGPLARYVRLTATSEVNNNAWTSVGEFTVLDDAGNPLATTVHAYDSQETVGENAPASHAIDGNPLTYWHTRWKNPAPVHPHYITLDLGSAKNLGGFVYVPRQDGANGRIRNYQVHHSGNASNWTLMTSGTWPDGTASQRFDSLLRRRAARSQIAGPATHSGGMFEVTITFDMNVSGLTPSDLAVTGGAVTALRGKGHYYVASMTPDEGAVEVAVAANAVDPAGAGSLPSATLAVAAPHAYDVWAETYGIDPGAAGYLLDPDKDGIASLLEFAFNMHPGQSAHVIHDPAVTPPRGLPRIHIADPARLSFSFPRRRNVPGLVYQAQFADAPGGFEDVTTQPVVEIIDDDWEVVTITDVAEAGRPARFGRVKVSLARP